MKRAKRSAYALIYMLAALPLIAVIGNVAVQITGRALRAQRMAVAERADDAALDLLLMQLRKDARLADRAESDADAFCDGATFQSGAQIVAYECTDSSVERVERSGDTEVSRTTWVLQHGRCAFRLEELANGRRLIWLRCDVHLSPQPRQPVTRHYATAIVVGVGGKP
jgi:hypothetical protein